MFILGQDMRKLVNAVFKIPYSCLLPTKALISTSPVVAGKEFIFVKVIFTPLSASPLSTAPSDL
jgi:hypothetical protein